MRRPPLTSGNTEVAILNDPQAGGSPNDKLHLDGNGYPTGQGGIVWGTFDRRQAEIIRNALLAQRIACEFRETTQDGKTLHLLRVAEGSGEREAMDFIWREGSGLRLKPDWSYAEGEVNRSFEQWLGGQ
jgi:hypothetical protein